MIAELRKQWYSLLTFDDSILCRYLSLEGAKLSLLTFWIYDTINTVKYSYTISIIIELICNQRDICQTSMVSDEGMMGVRSETKLHLFSRRWTWRLGLKSRYFSSWSSTLSYYWWFTWPTHYKLRDHYQLSPKWISASWVTCYWTKTRYTPG